ncbi:MAG: glutamine--fructose-6-phosphate transaminase (isomerizing) [Chloroflexi bacterium]|nr:glutamine--fructose-6-phosphate transaminase (isomerizing) [Chloroflexota bacterium]
MCGIVGYIGPRQASSLILESLRRLEYRGYDSAGIATLAEGRIALRRCVGKLDGLAHILSIQPLSGTVGIGHTRWATHGDVTEANAHPHTDCTGQIVVVHNGIVENCGELKEALRIKGHVFRSQTDTEVIAHLIEEHYSVTADLVAATRAACLELKGANAIVVLSTIAPDRLIAARLGNAGAIVIGYGQGEMFVSSDIPAILDYTQRMAFLDHGDVALVSAESVAYENLRGEAVSKEIHTIPWDPISAAKGGYKHFMLKEIHEQPRSVADAIRGRLDLDRHRVVLNDFPFTEEMLRGVERIYTVACGTAWHAALVGKFLIEGLAGLPVEVDYGSEFRYRNPLLLKNSLLLAITQSGETVDTLAAMEEARGRNIPTIAVVNVVGSQAARLADGVLYLNAGPEIGVASTKAFTSMLVAQYLFALYLGQLRGVISSDQTKRYVQDLVELPNLIGRVLENGDNYEALAQTYFERAHFLYLGRGINYPIALEGALKLKEISYIHAEGYPAGEMKHGPIALIDKNMPVVAIVVRDRVHDKMVSNVEQVKARGGTVIAIANEGDDKVAEKADHVIWVPETSPWLTPVLTVLPLQLLAYHIAVRRGCDVDQPRNLAKSVTVE